mgnify:CR=1 FL=1
MGFCTCMTLIETFKDQAPIVFGGSERLDRKAAQWENLFDGARPTLAKRRMESLMEAQRPIDDAPVPHPQRQAAQSPSDHFVRFLFVSVCDFGASAKSDAVSQVSAEGWTDEFIWRFENEGCLAAVATFQRDQFAVALLGFWSAVCKFVGFAFARLVRD